MILWALFLPIVAYGYVGRWKAFFIVLLGFIFLGGLVGIASENEEEAMANAFAVSSIVGPLVAGIDNSLAIRRARKNELDWSRKI